MSIGKIDKEPISEKEKPFVLFSDHLIMNMINDDIWESSAKKHFGDTGQNFDNRTNEEIEAFLSDYLDRPVQLLSIDKVADVNRGFPVWTFKLKNKE